MAFGYLIAEMRGEHTFSMCPDDGNARLTSGVIGVLFLTSYMHSVVRCRGRAAVQGPEPSLSFPILPNVFGPRYAVKFISSVIKMVVLSLCSAGRFAMYSRTMIDVLLFSNYHSYTPYVKHDK